MPVFLAAAAAPCFQPLPATEQKPPAKGAFAALRFFIQRLKEGFGRACGKENFYLKAPRPQDRNASTSAKTNIEKKNKGVFSLSTLPLFLHLPLLTNRRQTQADGHRRSVRHCWTAGPGRLRKNDMASWDSYVPMLNLLNGSNGSFLMFFGVACGCPWYLS